MPDLIQATRSYWRKLDELEAAYQRGEVSLDEVDARVEMLMAELGEARRETWQFFLAGLGRIWQEQREVIMGLALIGLITYSWVATVSM